MLSIQDRGARLCDGLNRRDWLHVGSLGTLGLTMPALLQARQAQAATPLPEVRKKAKACIMLFFLGAPPQQETWDPKPDIPQEYRGDLKPIQSATPGLIVGELMPKTAKLTEKIAVLRAMQTNDNAHSSSGYYMTTGFPHAPMGVENAKPGAPNDWPSLGSVVRKVHKGNGYLPSAVTLPEQSANDGNLTWPGQDAGFLGRTYDPWLLSCDPSAANFQVPGLTLPADVPAMRFDERRSLLNQVNQHLDNVQRSNTLSVYDAQSRQAFDFLSSSKARQAFNLDQESATVRDRYGRYRFGQSVLLARRLVEAGVPLVRINWVRVAGALNNGHWDTHSKNTDALKQLMPLMDQTYSTLLEDLEQRGLLEDTLVVWMAEFGRTPKINGNAGRDHWGHVFSTALAGGGVKGGVVHGASDKIAAYPKDGIVRPQDLTATIYHSLGISPESEIHDTQGRPLAITRGKVIHQIM
ncbi:MAG: DUF1501 domain-containing protein [Planctomycetia bacterium]|nr:DUF1501 domain-containing protein [Planctomycetia bacterium]